MYRNGLAQDLAVYALVALTLFIILSLSIGDKTRFFLSL